MIRRIEKLEEFKKKVEKIVKSECDNCTKDCDNCKHNECKDCEYNGHDYPIVCANCEIMSLTDNIEGIKELIKKYE